MDPPSADGLEHILAEAVQRLRQEFDPRAIYLFGSHAEGRAGPDSDLDLLVVLNESAESRCQRSTRAYRALRGLGVPKDVLVYTAREFDERARLPVSLERTIQDTRRLLYAA